VVVYLDDILIYLKTKEEHIKHVIAVLEILEKADVRINGAKSVFHV
jgi:Reverse transcriptase (RNA-dependent DNA polymerase)